MRKGIHGLTKIERGKLYGGDRTILYEKMGLIEEADIEKYKRRFGLPKRLDVTEVKEEELDQILHIIDDEKQVKRKTKL